MMRWRILRMSHATYSMQLTAQGHAWCTCVQLEVMDDALAHTAYFCSWLQGHACRHSCVRHSYVHTWRHWSRVRRLVCTTQLFVLSCSLLRVCACSYKVTDTCGTEYTPTLSVSGVTGKQHTHTHTHTEGERERERQRQRHTQRRTHTRVIKPLYRLCV